jgi:hypothetical protein
MRFSRRAALLALPAVIVTACTSSGGGGGNNIPSGMPTDPTALGSLLQSGLATMTSAHFDLGIKIAGQQLTGGGDEKVANGKLVALDLTETLPGLGPVRVILVNGTSYAKLPSALNSTGKPYLVVSPSSSNQYVRQLASSLDSALSAVALGGITDITSAAKSFDAKGTETIDGVQTTHYSIVVDVAKLPNDFQGKSAIQAAGLKTVPLELYVDRAGRPVRLIETLSAQGQTAVTTTTVTDYNKPVTITAPPSSQVGN